MKILVTGGAGYIGSTTCSALTKLGFQSAVIHLAAYALVEESLKKPVRYFCQTSGMRFITKYSDLSSIIDSHLSWFINFRLRRPG